jgi:hypothetical protein
MTFQELRKNYSSGDLFSLPGDPKLRQEAFRPILANLYDNQLVYRERFVCVVRLKDFVIDEVGFRGFCQPEITILDSIYGAPEEGWHFGGSWEHTRLIGNSLNDPYSGWTFWPEKERVRQVIELAQAGDFAGALALTAKEEH